MYDLLETCSIFAALNLMHIKSSTANPQSCEIHWMNEMNPCDKCSSPHRILI